MNKDLAPSGKLKIGLNYSNFLLVIGDDHELKLDRSGIRAAPETEGPVTVPAPMAQPEASAPVLSCPLVCRSAWL